MTSDSRATTADNAVEALSISSHAPWLFYFHDAIAEVLRRYKTAILSKQSTFPGLYRGALAAGAPRMVRAKESKKKGGEGGEEKGEERRRRRREKICTVCTLESFANISPSSSRYFRYVSNRGPTYFHFSQPIVRAREHIFFVLLKEFTSRSAAVKNRRDSLEVRGQRT